MVLAAMIRAVPAPEIVPDVIVTSTLDGVVHEAGTVNVPPVSWSLLLEPELDTVAPEISNVPALTLKSPALLMFRVSTVQVVEEGMAVPALVCELLFIVRTLFPAVSVSSLYMVPAPPY